MGLKIWEYLWLAPQSRAVSDLAPRVLEGPANNNLASVLKAKRIDSCTTDFLRFSLSKSILLYFVLPYLLV